MQVIGRMERREIDERWQNILWKMEGNFLQITLRRRQEIIEDTGEEKKSKEAKRKTNKKLQVDNSVIQTTCIELQEEVTKKVK